MIAFKEFQSLIQLTGLKRPFCAFDMKTHSAFALLCQTQMTQPISTVGYNKIYLFHAFFERWQIFCHSWHIVYIYLYTCRSDFFVNGDKRSKSSYFLRRYPPPLIFLLFITFSVAKKTLGFGSFVESPKVVFLIL